MGTRRRSDGNSQVQNSAGKKERKMKNIASLASKVPFSKEDHIASPKGKEPYINSGKPKF